MKLIIGNLKMNLTSREIDEYIDYFKENNYSNVYFCPSSIYLSKFVDSNLNTVSQDVSCFTSGAYTGDISAVQLKSIGIDYSLVGHSERRINYDDNKFVNEKIKRLLEQNMKPILCVGDSLDERKNKKYLERVEEEIREAFNNIDETQLANVFIAYEPVWSIGTGVIPSNLELEEVVSFIKKYVLEHYHYEVKVLYGGSVNNDNINGLEEIRNLDGYLVGGCSLNKDAFRKLIETIQ